MNIGNKELKINSYENDCQQVFDAIFPGADIPKIPYLQRNLNILMWRANEMTPFTHMNMREVPLMFDMGIIDRIDLSPILISALPVFLRDKNLKTIPMPNNALIFHKLDEGEKLSGAIQHDFFGPYDLGDKLLKMIGAELLKDKYGSMRMTVLGVVNGKGEPTALIQYYPGGGESGKRTQSFSAVTQSTKT